MARYEMTVEVKLLAIGAVSECRVCARLIAWKLEGEKMEDLLDLKCPVCRGSLNIEEESIVPEVVCEVVSR